MTMLKLNLNTYRDKFKYMGFIDADEFVFVRNNTYGGGGTNSILTFMDDFMAAHPNAGGLGINWLIFGSSHHEKKPEGGVLENFTMCAEKDSFWQNRFIKAIIDPARVLVQFVHSPTCRKGYYYLDENGEIIKLISGTLSEQVHFDKIRINHYFCKSLEEYIAIKQARGDVFFGRSLKNTTLDFFYDCDRNDIIDTEILSRR